MNAVDTSDALDLTKENIRPLKRGRKPIQLETALQAQSNTEIQQKLNKEKEVFEHAIRTYEGDDPIAPRFEYIKWLEQIYLKHGPESNLLPLIEETVQKFKDEPKYKQDPRFIQILINFIENQSNAVELYQTVYNQGLGTMCTIFYRAWADILDRYNDFKRVDQIFLLGIKAKAQPLDELEEAHMQFQLSLARRMLNGQLLNDEDKDYENDKRQAFNVLKKSETHSGLRQGSGRKAGKVPLVNNVNGKAPSLRVYEDNDENGLPGMQIANFNIASKGINKENTIKPGPWTKHKKSRTEVPKPVSTLNFEVLQDNNEECVTKLSGITVPNALRSIKPSNTIACPVAVFEPPDPTKRPMYCKDKVYAAGRDVQIEEIRYEIYLKQEKEKNLVNKKTAVNTVKSSLKEIKVEPLKNVISPENNFKVPVPLCTEPDTLSQSVTVNTRVAIDLVQQMWNSPCTDIVEKPISKDINPILFDGFDGGNKTPIQGPSNFMVYEDDDKIPIKEECVEDVFKLNQKEVVKNTESFYVYTDDQDNDNKFKCNKINIDKKDKNSVENIKISEVYVDDINENVEPIVPKVFIDNLKENNKNSFKIPEVYVDNDTEIKSPLKKIPVIENDDDLTCSTKAFAFLLTSSTPLASGRMKSKNVTVNQLPPIKKLEETKVSEESQETKNLSVILEASKERNSSTSSGIIAAISSVTKLEQQSIIDFGMSINPFDEGLLNKLLKKVIKYPNERHMFGYVEHDSDMPNIRSDFKLGQNKMSLVGNLGKGSYARVVKARSENNKEKALKIQKPSCHWEWYIHKEIQYRLKDSEKLSYFINMDNFHVFKNGSIITMDFATHGTLLSVILAYKKANLLNRSIPVTVAALFASQITTAVKYLHQCQIIHGDLKPDNVIVKSIPNQSFLPCVQLIDFGRSIDMTLFPPDTTFTYSVKTADFICHEMMENLPWTYQTDYFGLAGIIYMILMSDYMKTQKIRKVWVAPLPRYLDKDLWDTILKMLLNIESCQKLPNLDDIIDKLNKYLSNQQNVVLKLHFDSFKNALLNH